MQCTIVYISIFSKKNTMFQYLQMMITNPFIMLHVLSNSCSCFLLFVAYHFLLKKYEEVNVIMNLHSQFS